MRLRPHQLSAGTFAALAAGGGGAGGVRVLADVQYSKHMLLVWGVMDTARAAGHAQARAAHRAYELLASIQEHAPAAVAAVLRYPSVGAWGECTLRALRGDAVPVAGEPAQLAGLAAAAAIRSGQPCTIDVPARDGMIVFPSVGQVMVPPGCAPDAAASVRCTSGGTRVIMGRHTVAVPADTGQDAPAWRGLRPVGAVAGGMAVRFVVDDLDPYRMPSAPALGGRLDDAEVSRWQTALREAWDLLVRLPGTTAEEIREAIRVLTPLSPATHGQHSASSRQVFGCTALSPPSDGQTLAVTLAHEVQHAKLGALLDVVTLTHPGHGKLYYAPWRDDPRPIPGLLQGAYAYLGVSRFWRWQRHQESGTPAIRAHAEFARWRDAATMVSEVLLASGSLTGAGTAFVSGMHATLAEWAHEEVPAAALRLARRDSERHLARWRQRHGEPAAPSPR
jgi:HEXXH motif-containing protein